ncbi:MAG: SPOR domain-containing protein [Bacteroidales bacterium]|nr:SPOR domain-containing protein [Candidatus Equimonas enterica]
MRYIALMLWLIALSVTAQNTYTEKLTKQEAGKGTVVLHQDEAITSLVNGTQPVSHPAAKPKAAETTPKPVAHEETPTPAAHSSAPSASKGYVSGARHSQQGFRVQVYTGGNQRKHKQMAQAVAAKVKKAFPELSTYVNFNSPQWICRVGDFRTRGDANRYAQKIRAAGISREAHAVKSVVLVR